MPDVRPGFAKGLMHLKAPLYRSTLSMHAYLKNSILALETEVFGIPLAVISQFAIWYITCDVFFR
jgi:hypothetical protein